MARTEAHAILEDEPPSAFQPLRTPVFRNVWIASTISNFGSLIQAVGASWLMTSISQSADMVALVQSALTAPVMLLSLLAGALADNADRRKTILAAQVFMLCVSIALTVCAWTGVITPWLLLFFTFVIACGSAFNLPAWQASVGDMVPRTQLPAAVALNSISYNIARSVGPALGGLIVVAAGAGAAFAVNSCSYLYLIAVLLRWRPAAAQRALPPEPLGIAILSGVRYVRMSPAILTVLSRSFVFGIGASAVYALLPLVAKHLMNGSALTYGVLLGAFGVGAIVGALGTARLRRWMSVEVLASSATVALSLVMGAIALSSHRWLTILALLIGGGAWVLTLSTFNVTVQMSAPRWVVGRALSLYQMVTFTGIAAGSWLWGTVAENHGLATAILCAAGVTLCSAILGRVLPLRDTGELNLDPLRGWEEPATAVPVEPRTGPVVITIEYRIAEGDVLEFLAAMSERRRIRRRDGARNWCLLRDLGDAEVWIERYQSPTWMEYIRHNSRPTQDDATIPQRLRALHRGPDAPIVRRMIERQTGSLPTDQTPMTHGYIDR